MGLPSQRDEDRDLSDQEVADKLRAESSYYAFVKQAWHVIEPEVEYVDNWHIEAICVHLESVLAGEVPNLLVNIPPGGMKSILCSVLLVPWAWIRWPSMRFLCASYEQQLATRDSVSSREVIRSEWYQRLWGDRFTVTTHQDEKTRYDNDQRGWRIATSVGGRGIGEHPDIVVGDDLHHVRRIESEKEREGVLTWWGGTIATRGKIRDVRRIVVMQRVHHEDLPGMICKQHGGDTLKVLDTSRWSHIALPMRYEPDRMLPTHLGWNDPRNENGELLWPAAFSETKVSELEADMAELGPEVAAGQLQQRPTPRGGRLFRREWFELVDAAPRKADRVRYFDKAGTKGGGAYTAGVLVARDQDGVFYVEDVVREQLEPTERNRLIRQTVGVDDEMYSHVETWVEQEPGSGGKESWIITSRELARYDVHADRVTGDKESRAMPFAAACGNGNVRLVRGGWNKAFLDELEAFPRARYKDQVDAAAGAYMKLAAEKEYTVDDFLCSGENPTEERRPFSPDEIEELPDFLRELVTESRAMAGDRRMSRDDDEGFRPIGRGVL